MSGRRKCRPLAVESLESRELMAGDVTASVSGQLLTITGDDAANGVVLTYHPATKSYRVTGTDAGGAGTSINGASPAGSSNFAEFTNVRQIAVKLAGGNDQFSVGSPAATDAVISKWFTIEMGDGDDQVQLGRAGGLPNTADPAPFSLQVGTSLNIKLGAGNDDLQMAYVTVGTVFQVFGGDGDDNINFATSFTPAGGTQDLLYPVRVRGTALINGEAGQDDLSIKNSFFFENLRLPDTSDAANIEIINTKISKLLDIDTGNLADVVKLDYVHAKQLTLDTNAGADDIDITNARFNSLNLKLGAGRDDLLLRSVVTTVYAYMDGGSQGSNYTKGPGNRLRGQWRRNLG